MSELAIRFDFDVRAFEPGDVLRGEVAWQLDGTPTSLAVALYWETSGKGTQDVEIVQRVQLAPAGASGAAPFSLTLPAEPPSFSGRLITLTWYVEATAEPGEVTVREPIVLAPGGREILLGEPAAADAEASAAEVVS